MHNDAETKNKAPPVWQRCLVALLIIGAASAFRMIFFGGLGRSTPYLLYYPGVMLAALYGGLPAGLLATAFSAPLCFFWLLRGSVSPVETLGMAVFVLSCSLISVICESLHRARARATAAQEKTETANQDLQSAVAEHKRAETALIASETRYRRLFESAKDGILILDAQTGMVVDVNPFLAELLGFTHEQFLGKAVWELGFFKDIAANEDKFAQLRDKKYVRYENLPLETRDGRRIEVEFVSNVYLVDGRKVIQCNVRDISARVASDRQLREQYAILTHSHEGIMIVGLDNKVSLWNHGAEEIFGWPVAEALNRPPEQLLGVDDSDVVSNLRVAIEREGFWNGELLAQSRDGRKLIVDCRITLVRDDAGRPRGRLNLLTDITEKKLLEEKLLRVQRLESIGTLSSGIAHDLNNILAPMLMIAPMLKEKMTDPQSVELLTMIEQGAQRGANIIRQLLTFSRGIEGERGPVQPRHLLKEMTAIMRETFPREITVKEDLPPDLWPVNADATQIHQVLMNLCVNARDALHGGGTITIAADNLTLGEDDLAMHPSASPGSYVRITVSDTGEGIPREDLDRIFEPFFTTKEIGKGTGLGLSMVVGIVKSHGGFITVYSEPGHGAVFKVYLPAIVGAAQVAAAAAAVSWRGSQELILIVDDEAAIRRALSLTLARNNYRVLVAADSVEAVRLFLIDRQSVRLVLTDIMMPGMNGVALIRALRGLEPGVHIVAASGLHDEDRRAELAALGVTNILAKPFSTDELLEAVQRELAARV